MRVRVRAPFPLGAPTWPTSVPRPPVVQRTGAFYDTEWARKYPARLARAVIVDDVLRPLVRALASPTVHGLDRIVDLEAPAIFASNHHSHVDTPLLLTSLPEKFRHKTLVAAAADYFFDKRTKGAMSALVLGAIPIERTRVNRRSSDLAADLLHDGWSLIIFPEGGRSPDGWAQDFRGGAAYLALRCGRPLVPIHVAGSRRVQKKGQKLPTPVGRNQAVQVTFGTPLRPLAGEDARRLATRLQAAVATLAEEATTDWWTARRHAAAGITPSLSGPQAGAWRRSWALGEHKRRSSSAGDPWP